MPRPGAATIASHGRVGLISALTVSTWGRLAYLDYFLIEVEEGAITVAVIRDPIRYTVADIIERVPTEAVIRAITPTEAIVVGEYITQAIISPQYVKVEIPERIREVLAEVLPGGFAGDYLIDVGNNTYLVSKDNVFLVWRDPT